MTQAANLAALAGSINSSGQLSLTTGTTGTLSASSLTGTLAKTVMPSGSVIQTVQTQITTTFSTSSSTWTDVTGFSVSITPTSSSNKVLVMLNVQGNGNLAGWYGTQARLLRGSTPIAVSTAASSPVVNATFDLSSNYNSTLIMSASMNWLDTPATSSVTTYKLQVQQTQGQNMSLGQNPQLNSGENYLSKVPCAITLMEIVG